MEQRNLFSTPWEKKKHGKSQKKQQELTLTLRTLTKCAHSTPKQTFPIVITFFFCVSVAGH